LLKKAEKPHQKSLTRENLSMNNSFSSYQAHLFMDFSTAWTVFETEH